MNKTEPVCFLTNIPPKKPGFYWFFDGGEHTPAMVEVVRDFGKPLTAFNEEFMFDVSKKPEDGEYWGQIPMPFLDGKIIKPGSY